MRITSLRLLLLIILLIAAISLLFVNMLQKSQKQKFPVESSEKLLPPLKINKEEKTNIEIFKKVSPSVCFIKNAALARDFFSLNIYEVPQGEGSGFVWDKKGHIVTNFHVVYKSDKIKVILSSKKGYSAKIVGISPNHDLAVLKIDAKEEELFPITTGISENLLVGQKILAIGNPFGLDHTLTTGIISALGRSIKSLTDRNIYDMIQTDAAINPGNSGGPLLNSSGEAVGMATAIYSPSGAYAGVGFAIPIDIINRIVPELIEHGEIKQVGLGIILVPDKIRKMFAIEGAPILKTLKDGPAQRAGLEASSRTFLGEIEIGDIIISIDGKKISSNDDLIKNIEKNYKAGDKVEIEFLRDNRKIKTTAVLEEL
ncbi:S1C family serine protease [Elusimicrobiota bacterium]